ncbi:MAG: hypothetical protein AB1644_03025 [Candidatus Zixiibacteriota bacterium]
MFGIMAISFSDIGVALTLAAIGGGLVWLTIRSVKGREVPRRLIFAFVFVAVSLPVLFPITFKERMTPTVKAVFDKIESLPPGSRVLMSFDFDPAMAPEVQPMADAYMRHCLSKGHRVVFMSLWATGQALMTTSLDRVVRREFSQKVNGVDYAVIGYKAGNEGVLNVIVTDIRKMFPTDVNTVPLDSLPIFDGVRSCKDFDLVLTTGGGYPGAKEWVLFVGDPGNVPIASGVAAVTAPLLYPYYPRQILGILGGIKGAAEYEHELVNRYPQFADTPAPGLRMMGPQTLAHLVIMAFIIIGNITYFRSRKKEPV